MPTIAKVTSPFAAPTSCFSAQVNGGPGRLSLSTEFVLPVPTRARFPGRVSRSTGHASSIRTSLDRARDKANGAPGSADRGLIRTPRGAPPLLWRDHEVPRCSGSVVHFSPRTKNADPQTRIGAQSLPGPPAIIRHAEPLSPRAPFSFTNACTTNSANHQWIEPHSSGP